MNALIGPKAKRYPAYNETDPYLCLWLSNLSDAGTIPRGVVDPRSIRDVQPDDFGGFRQVHFFAGVGIWGFATLLAGWPEDEEIWTASCPCQPFSVAGKGLGADDPGTYGPTCFASSVPEGPLSWWESRLRWQLAGIGSMECSLTWKASVTPAGRSYCRLVLSTRRIAVIDCGSSPCEKTPWATPTSRDWKDSPGMVKPRAGGRLRNDSLPWQVYGMLWPTPTASANKSIRKPEGAKKEVERGKSPDLAAQTMALWPTPTSLTLATRDYNGAGNSAGLVAIREIALSLYPTPTTACANGGQTSRGGSRKEEPLLGGIARETDAVLWPTPMTRSTGGGEYADPEKARTRMASGHQVNLADTTTALWPTPLSAPESPASHNQISGQFRTAMQQALPGSSATTAKPAGSLNPEFVFWLMGFPPEFLNCAPPAMRSFRKSRRKSSARCAEDESIQSSAARPT